MYNYSDESKKQAQTIHEAVGQKAPRKIKTPKTLAVINQAGCTGCEVCIQFCPVDCIEVVPGPNFPELSKVVEVDLNRCIGCKLCAKYCPWDTIEMIPADQSFETANDWTLRTVVKLGQDKGQQLWSKD
jgi:ferredoxin